MSRSAGSALRGFLERFGDMVSRFILGLIYFVFVTPIGLVLALVRDPLRIRRWEGSSFAPWVHRNETIERARKQIS